MPLSPDSCSPKRVDELLNAGHGCLVKDEGGDEGIPVIEVRRIGTVCTNAAHIACKMHDDVRFVLPEHAFDRGGFRKIEVGMCCPYDLHSAKMSTKRKHRVPAEESRTTCDKYSHEALPPRRAVG